MFLLVTAGYLNCTGQENVFLGFRSGYCNQSGTNNVFLGNEAGRDNTTGKNNIALGQHAGHNGTTGCYNIFFGKESAGDGTVSGNSNISIGCRSGQCISSGCYNVFFGACAGKSNTSGDSNIAIGCAVQLPSATADCQLAIGNGSNRWITGDNQFSVTIADKLKVSTSGIVTASSGTVTYYGDGSQLQNVGLSLTVDTSSNATRYLLFDGYKWINIFYQCFF